MGTSKTDKPCQDISYAHDSYIDGKLSKFSSIDEFSAVLYKSKGKYEIFDIFKDHHVSPDNGYIQGVEDPRLFRFKGDIWVYAHFRGVHNSEKNTLSNYIFITQPG